MSLKAKDIAEMLGVSTATVSLVINNKSGVGEQKRQEIINKIKELGCEYLLKDISINQGNIGFVVYKTVGKIIDESPFFNYILEGINNRLNEYGYNLNFVYLNKSTPIETQKLQLRAVDCKGYIVFGVEMQKEDLRVFIDSGHPFVVLDNSFSDEDVDSVAINNDQGVSLVMRYAYEMGHRKIGYVRCKERIISFEERYRAYRSWLDQLGLVYDARNIFEVSYSEKGINNDIKKSFQNVQELPTLLFAENDYIACNTMQALQEMGYKVPDDISVIGFDDRPICQMVVPAVTTVNVPKDAFGGTAVDLLIKKMQEARNYSLKTKVGVQLVVRSSVSRRSV